MHFAANNRFFEALSMLDMARHHRKVPDPRRSKRHRDRCQRKNYEVEDDNVLVEIDPDSAKFNVALVQNVVADEDWVRSARRDRHHRSKVAKSYEVEATAL